MELNKYKEVLVNHLPSLQKWIHPVISLIHGSYQSMIVEYLIGWFTEYYRPIAYKE